MYIGWVIKFIIRFEVVRLYSRIMDGELSEGVFIIVFSIIKFLKIVIGISGRFKVWLIMIMVVVVFVVFLLLKF